MANSNVIDELYDKYTYQSLSMGLSLTSIANYLVLKRGAKAIIYGKGYYAKAAIRILKERTRISPVLIVGDESDEDIVEGVPSVRFDNMPEGIQIAFVATGRGNEDLDKSSIYTRLKEKNINLIVDLDITLGKSNVGEFYGYFESHRSNFVERFNLFEDDLSKDTYYHYIKAILCGKDYEGIEFSETYKYWGGGESPFFKLNNETWVNCGSCFGDTIFEFLANDVPVSKIYAVEGNEELFKSLEANIMYLDAEERNKISLHNTYVGVEGSETIDSIVGRNAVSLINMDIEGFEMMALQSAKETIKKHHPVLSICVYHKPDDLLVIPDYISDLYSGYRFFLRKYLSTGGTHYSGRLRINELVLYAIPKERVLV